jgi:hypothetical protein
MFWKNKPESDSPPRPMVATFTFIYKDGHQEVEEIEYDENDWLRPEPCLLKGFVEINGVLVNSDLIERITVEHKETNP